MENVIVKGLEVLNSQINQFDFEIEFQYKNKKKEIEFQMVDFSGNVAHYKTYTLSKEFREVRKILVDFGIECLEIIKYGEDEIAQCSNESYTDEHFIAFEYDQWMSASSKQFKGVFDSKLKALLELQKHYETLIEEENNGVFIDFAEELEEDTQFEKISISELTLNEVQ